MNTRDVVVVGAGIVGVSCAWELHRRGVAVTLLDRGEVSSGTTGLGEGNVLASDKEPGPELDLTIAGLDVYDEIDDHLGEVARIRRKGALIVHTSDATWSREAERVATMPGELVDPDTIREMEPNLTGELLGASFFPRDLQVDPRGIARALASELPDVRTGVEIASLDDLDCDAVVLAAGPWTAALSPVRLPLEPRKGQLVKLRAAGSPQPFFRHKVVDGAYLGSVLSDDAGLQISTVVETTWEGDVLVGSSRERRGFDVSVDDSVSDAMVERAARLAPGLTELERIESWAGLRPWLPDNLPAIGPSSARDGLWIATGHEGAGVALGPVTGRLIAQLYCGEAPLIDPAPFSPDRFL